MFNLTGDAFVAFLAASLSFIRFLMSGVIQGVEEILPILLFFRGAWISKDLLQICCHIMRVISERGKDGFSIYLLRRCETIPCHICSDSKSQKRTAGILQSSFHIAMKHKNQNDLFVSFYYNPKEY